MPLSYPDQQVITKSPGVLQFPGNITSLQMLKDDIPDIKLLFIVKNPVQRIIGDIIHEYTSGYYRFLQLHITYDRKTLIVIQRPGDAAPR